MEKIFKKSLALMVSAALCLTAFVGCLTVNAETAGSATVTVGEVTAKTTDTMVEVPVTIAVGEDATTGIAAAIFDITVDFAKFNFSKRNWAECLTYDTKQNIHVSTITNGDFIQPVSGTTDTYRFLVEGLAEGSTDENTLGTFTSATFNLTFDVIDNTAGETAITFNTDKIAPQACNAGTLDLQGKYTGDEKAFRVDTVAGKITVEHTHDYSTLKYNETNHWRECSCGKSTEPEAHKYGEGVITKEPTATELGTKTYTCTVCGHSYTEDIPATGPTEPVEVELTFQHTVSLKSNIQLAIVPKLTGTVFNNDNNVTKVYAICQQIKLDDNNNEYVYTSDKVYAASNGYFYYGDLLAYEMSHTVSTVIYGCDADGNILYKSNVDQYSVLQYAANQFAKPSSTDSLKKVLADLLNYGSAAQTYADYNAENLVNKTGEITTPYGSINIQEQVTTHETKEDPTLTGIADNVGDSALPEMRNSLSLKSAIEVMYAIPKSAVDTYGKENVKLVINYYGKDYTISGSDFGTYGATYYNYYFKEVIAADFNKTLTADLYYGETKIAKTRIYSVESYCANKLSDSDQNLVAVCKAIMKYGISVDSYFS